MAAFARPGVLRAQTIEVPNGGFENGNTKNLTFNNPGGGVFACSVTSDPQHVRTGKYALAVTPTGIRTSEDGSFATTVSIEGIAVGTVLRAVLYVKAENVALSGTEGVIPRCIFLDENEDLVRLHEDFGQIKGTHDYVRVEMARPVPEGASFIRIEIRFPKAIVVGALYLDDMTIEIAEAAPAEETWPPNGGFEEGTTSGWVIYQFKGPCLHHALTSEPSQVHSGRYALAITPQEPVGVGDGGLYIEVDISRFQPGTPLCTSFYYKAVDFQLADSQQVRVFMQFLDEAKKTIETNFFDRQISDTTDYVKTESVNPVPAGAARALIELYLPGAPLQGALYLDDFAFETGEPPAHNETWPPNSGFEDGTAADWQFWNPPKAPLDWGVTSDSHHVHSGTFALAVTRFEGDQGLLYRDLEIRQASAGDFLRFRCFLETKDLSNGGDRGIEPFLSFYDHDGHHLPHHAYLGDIPEGTREYTLVELTTRVPDGAVRLRMGFYFNSSIQRGSFYLDDFDVTVLDKTSIARPVFDNGDFELGNTWHWKHARVTQAIWETTSDPDLVRSGRYAAVIRNPVGNTGFHITNTAIVGHLPPRTVIHTSLFVKTKDLVPIERGRAFCIKVVVTEANDTTVQFYGPSSFDGTYDWVNVRAMTQLHPRAENLTVVLTCGPIASGTICIDDVTVEVYDPPRDAISPPTCVEIHPDANGAPRLVIDGQARAPVFFFGNQCNTIIYKEMSRASEVGAVGQVLTFFPWETTSTGMLAQMHANDPDAYLMPWVYLGEPAYWVREHLDEVIVEESGQLVTKEAPFSLASDAYYDEVLSQLEMYLRFLHSHSFADRIIGYGIGAEWLFGRVDYSEVNRLRFIEWLRARYSNDIGDLNLAWGKTYARFADVRIPPTVEWDQGYDGLFRDPLATRGVSDFLEYHSQLVVDRILQLAKQVKDLTAGRLLVEAAYGYLNQTPLPRFGNNALKRLLASPYIDIIGTPVSFFDKQVGGPSNFMTIVDTIHLHGKLHCHQDDTNTWLNDPSGRGDDYNVRFYTEWDTLNALRRNFSNILVHGSKYHWCDLHADGRFDADSIWRDNQMLADAYNDSIAREIAYRPEVALIYDEESPLWMCQTKSWDLFVVNQSVQRSVFQSIGAPVGYYFVEDIDLIPDSVKLFVFVNTFRLTQEERAKIESLKSGGRTLLWEYAPGYVTETGLSLEGMETLTGFPLQKRSWEMIPTVRILTSSWEASGQLAGHRFCLPDSDPVTGRLLAPTFTGDYSEGGFQVLGYFDGTAAPALMRRQFGEWTSIFCSAPMVSVPVLRAIAKEAGVRLLVNPDDLYTKDAVNYNGRYLFVYAREKSGPRTFRVGDDPVDVVELVSGEEMGRGVLEWTCWFQQNEQKTFRITPTGEN